MWANNFKEDIISASWNTYVCVSVIGRCVHLWKAPGMRAQIKCLKQKYKMEAQLHTGNNDLKHSVRNIYRGRGPRVVGTLPWAGGDGHSPTHWDSQFKPVITTVPHHELHLEKESFNLEMRQHTPNVYTKVPGVESLQLLIQKTHSSPQ